MSAIFTRKEYLDLWSKLFYLSVLVFFVEVMNVQPGFAHAPSADPLKEIDFEQNLNAQVPLELTFRDERGNLAPLRRYVNEKPVMLVFAYYECPNLCSLVLEEVTNSLKSLSFNVGDQFNVITVTIDPTETPAQATAAKAKYTERYDRPGVADGWHFLTGEHEFIDQLADVVGLKYTYDAEKDQYAHATGVVILTPQGKISRYLYGLDYSPRDLRLGLVDASANKIGSWVDQVLLRCYQYDPVTGRYTPLVMNIIRIAGLITVSVIGAVIFIMLKWERATSSAAK